MKDSLKRICATAAIASLVLLYGIGLFFAKDIDALNAGIESDLRPRVRSQRPIPLSIRYELSADGTNYVRLTNYNEVSIERDRRRYEALEQELAFQQHRAETLKAYNKVLENWVQELRPSPTNRTKIYVDGTPPATNEIAELRTKLEHWVAESNATRKHPAKVTVEETNGVVLIQMKNLGGVR